MWYDIPEQQKWGESLLGTAVQRENVVLGNVPADKCNAQNTRS